MSKNDPSPIFIGVDPGQFGFVASIEIQGDMRINLLDTTPLKEFTESDKKLRWVAGEAYGEGIDGTAYHVMIESQRAMPRDSAHSATVLSQSYASALDFFRKVILIEGTSSNSLRTATPQAWQAGLAHEFPFRVDRTRCEQLKKSYIKQMLEVAINRSDLAGTNPHAYDSIGIAIYSYMMFRNKLGLGNHILGRLKAWG